MRSRTPSRDITRRESPLLGVARLCLLIWLVLVVQPSCALAQSGAAIQPGDRIIVITHGDSTRVDTVTVQTDRTITLQRLPPISLEGVQRSDLEARLNEQLHQYVKHTVLRAIPLVSVGVLGEVVHPGYYRVPLGISLSDLLMIAGGPSPQADMLHVQVRRGRTVLLDQRSARDAMVRRLPLDELGIDAGDEVVLKPVPQRNWLLITQLAGVATGLVLAFRTLKIF